MRTCGLDKSTHSLTEASVVATPVVCFLVALLLLVQTSFYCGYSILVNLAAAREAQQILSSIFSPLKHAEVLGS